MKDSELYNKVSQTLQEFESLEDIQPSSGWNDSMMARMAASRVHPPQGSPVSRVALVLLVVILANMGILLSLISNNSTQSLNRGSDLRAISREFLVNPISISE